MNVWKSFMWTADKEVNFAVMNTTWAVVKIRPEKISGLYGIVEVMGSNPVQAWIFFRPYFHYCLRSVHYYEDRFHIHDVFCWSPPISFFIHIVLVVVRNTIIQTWGYVQVQTWTVRCTSWLFNFVQNKKCILQNILKKYVLFTTPLRELLYCCMHNW